MRSGDPAGDWFADDEMWSAFASVMFSDTRLAGTPAEVDQVVQLLDLKPGAAVLDMCCGPGRHALELARRGFAVTGVDRMAAYLARARDLAKADGLDVDLVESDVREFCRPESFDAVISMFTSFGYFRDLADDVKQLTNACQSLKPGGDMLIQTLGKEEVSRRYQPRLWSRYGDDFLLMEHVVIGPWQRMELRWTLLRKDGSRSEASLNIRLYSAVELASVLREAGFDTVTFYGDLARNPYDHSARQMVAVARK